MEKRQNQKLVLDNIEQKNQNTNIMEAVDNISTTDSDMITKALADQYQAEITLLESQLAKLDVNYKGMLAREKRYLKNIKTLKTELENNSASSIARQDFIKIQANYEGLLAREERYLKEIKSLQDALLEQKNSLYRTYSYRLGYLLIHSTKSFKSFFRLPAELIRLYRDNKQRKNIKLELPDQISSYQDKKKQGVKTISRTYKPIEESYLEDGRERVKIATIMDEFTSLCFAPEAETLQITPESFEEELNQFKPDFVFIESAWQGKDGLWKLKISQQADELLGLIDYCRKHNIKTLFWNKEDPVHFGTFIEVAKLVDVVFTTDIDCIQKYKETVQHDAVYLMPFAAQPKVHNPIELYERIDKFNFAGSYYLKYPVRQRDFAVLSDVAINSKGLDIYDRNFNNDHPHYQFPERYQSLILGSLAPEEIDKAYKGYEFGVNMNTIKQSQTMFARRVFEMLASNTIVLSNYSRGVRLLFGDLVVCSDNENELQRQVDSILESTIKRKKFKLQGLRSVLSQHTYEHRLNYILQKLKINRVAKTEVSRVVVLSKCETQAEIEYVVGQFQHQVASDKILIIETNISARASENIRYAKDSKAVLDMISSLDFTHITIFNKNDYYGKNYLTDMLDSYHYLKYHNNVPVTKNSYYSYSQNQLLERSGTEYQFVGSYATARTLYTQTYFIEIIKRYQLSDLIDGLLIKDEAFSIDCFSYVQNGQVADQKSIEIICHDLVLDSGVSLPNHLLPISEAITFSNYAEPIEKVLPLDHVLIKETLRKEIKFSTSDNSVIFESTLPANQHRLVTLTSLIELEGWDRVKLKSEIESGGDVLLVFQFLDKNQKQITHITTFPAASLTIEIPKEAVFGKVSLRFKGQARTKINNDIQCYFENIVRGIEPQSYDSENIVTFTKDDIDKELVRPKSKQILINNRSNGLEIKSTLAEDKHAYVYFRTIYTREEVNLVLNSVFETTGEINGFDFRTVFLFLDRNKEKLGHSIIKVDNHSHAMAIPEDCQYVRIGFKITGAGVANLQTLKVGEIREGVNSFIGKSDTLVLAKQYPAYNDLYKYGFLHTRLKSYKNEGIIANMFKFSNDINHSGFSEFESIDVFTGDADSLRKSLESGQFKKVLVHLIDHNMWNILREFSKDIKIYIWVHGAEIQTWERREFEFELMDESQINRQKRLSDQRKRFWQNLLDHDLNKNIHFIFVSQYFLEESEEGLERRFPKEQVSIIHNYIDTDAFPYIEKPVEQRYKLLSIRPYASRKYANDMTVNAILELSKSSEFSKFEIALYGDGVLFDETVKPLREFKNVLINKRFLSHAEISALHKEYGVFLTPTRMDSQGVSRDEAMSSGLVPVTTAVTAIPEFVDKTCAILVEEEDYKGMANGVLQMALDDRIFVKLSSNAVLRVKKQCGFESTTLRELRYFNDKEF